MLLERGAYPVKSSPAFLPLEQNALNKAATFAMSKFPSPPSEMMFQAKSPSKPTEDDDERFEKLFSRSFQEQQEELNSKNFKAVDTLTSKYQAVNKEGKAAEEEGSGTKTEEQKGFDPSFFGLCGCEICLCTQWLCCVCA